MMISLPYSLTGLVFVVALLWSFAWKGVALWKAARNNDMVWFVVLLFVNTLGILEIVYIYLFSHPNAPAFSIHAQPKKSRAASKKKSSV